ncbi:MAG: serine protease [Gammaproteobacteria bacterium]|nr:serine protease [Gammaproteobacteria bacterium]
MNRPCHAVRHRIIFLLSLVFLGLTTITPAHAVTTESVFNRFKDRLLQIRIIDKATNSKSVIGSGFFVDEHGTIVTNFHVVSRQVFKPEDYRIEYVTEDNRAHPAQLLNIDVIHDLALLRGDSAETPSLYLRERKLEKGERIYTLGDPLDLGMTIVEGTYNGLTDDTMHERILLAGALNPGMSGGPSITEDGTIIGVNVATAGNSIGFLVPEKFLRSLARENKSVPVKDYMQVIRQQLFDNQNIYIKALLQKPFPVKQLDNYTVPGRLARYINCWGDSGDDHGPYTTADDYCAIKNTIFLNSRMSTGEIRYNHHLIKSDSLNRIRFYNLMEDYFTSPQTSLSGGKDDFTEFQCKTEFVQKDKLKLKTALCLRRYKAFDGLYDMVLHSASVTENDRGLITTLVLSGVSYDNAIAFAKAYLESLAWKPR